MSVQPYPELHSNLSPIAIAEKTMPPRDLQKLLHRILKRVGRIFNTGFEVFPLVFAGIF